MGRLMGPRTPFSQQLHQEKYRQKGESFDDYAVRYARTTADDQAHFRKLLEGLRSQAILPAGRQQRAVGWAFQTTAFNCLKGDTEFLSDRGFLRLDEVVDQDVAVLSPTIGRMVPAKGRAFGEQILNRITISTTFRNQGETFFLHATANHRWPLQDGSVIDDLQVGDVLAAGHSVLRHDPNGFVHGLVFGDGTKVPAENTYTIRLCGRKATHLPAIKESDVQIVSVTSPPSCGGDPIVRLRSGESLKQLPNAGQSVEYVAGFIAGYLAADGCMKEDIKSVHSVDRSALEWLRDHMILAGYAPVGGIKVETKPSNFGERQPLYRLLFRSTEQHGGFRVLAIDEAVSSETVYCLEVPEGNQFTLRNGLRTGNCFTGPRIGDDMGDIMSALKDGAMTLRSGGGCGWDFSTLRPEGEPIRRLGEGARASGPVSFMGMWNSMCNTIRSAGERRGAMMGILRVDHPDIMTFVRAKQNGSALTNFNISVAVTDEFMRAVEDDGLFALKFGGVTHSEVRALDLWAVIMENNWDWGEPGVLFIDQINRMNPLNYCETIYATNPCFTGDTKVWTAYGPKMFSELALTGDTIPVLTQLDDGTLAYRDMTKPRVTKRGASLVEVKFRGSGRKAGSVTTVRCTPNHKFHLKDGRAVEARDLARGDRVFSAYRGAANQKGYVRLHGTLDRPLEHHVAVEYRQGRRPNADEDVHHVNERKDDNRPENVEIKDRSSHLADHMTGDRNPARRMSHRNPMKLNPDCLLGDKNGRWRGELDESRMKELRKEGKTFSQIAKAVGCSKYTVQKRLGTFMKKRKAALNHVVLSVKVLDVQEDVYCGTVAATGRFFVQCGENEGVLVSNCSEKPMPPDGACLLLSQNVVKYLVPKYGTKGYEIDRDQFARDAALSVRANDNVFEKTIFPLPAQKKEAFDKRRMGVGMTGVANALEICGHRYASPGYVAMQDELFELQRDVCFKTSIDMARVKGPFPLFDADKYLATDYARTLPDEIRWGIKKYGLRNGILLSVAPTGTISWTADNVSSGIEPPCAIEGMRTVKMPLGDLTVAVNDWAYEEHGHRCLTADQVSPQDHVKVLCAAQKWVDSSISKTINVTGSKQSPPEPGTTPFEEFKDVYKLAYHGGAKGCAAFNRNGKRAGIITNVAEEPIKEGAPPTEGACYLTPQGQKICGD